MPCIYVPKPAEVKGSESGKGMCAPSGGRRIDPNTGHLLNVVQKAASDDAGARGVASGEADPCGREFVPGVRLIGQILQGCERNGVAVFVPK